MTRTPLVSIIIPVYNVDKFLPRCLDSICNQTYSHLEIILVDNAATKGCLAICEKRARQDSRIKIVHLSQNAGIAGARKAGIANSTGDFIGFCDSDDWFEINAIETLLNLYQQTGAEILWGNINYCPEHKKSFTKQLLPQPDNQLHLSSEDVLATYALHCWNKLYTRRLIDAGLQFDPAISSSEDFYFVFQALQLANFTAFTATPTYNYFLRSTSDSHTPDISRCIDNVLVNERIFLFCKQKNFSKAIPVFKGHLRGAQCALLVAIMLYDFKNQFREIYRKTLKELRQHLNEIFYSKAMGLAGKIFMLFPLALPSMTIILCRLPGAHNLLHRQYLKRMHPEKS